MTRNLKLWVVALAIFPVTTLQAQTYNDTVRTHTWSIYGQGGISTYHGLRDATEAGVRRTISPDVAVGVKYNIKPWARIGLNVEYTKLKATNKNVLSTTTKTEGYKIGDYTDGVLTTQTDQLSTQNYQHFLMTDLNVDFNILDIWHNRKAQHWNLWLGTGIGYVHGWARNETVTAVDEEGISKGTDHFNVYNHSYVTTSTCKWGTNALYVPVSLSLEYDITPRWTAGVYGQYKWLPQNKCMTPKGIVSAGVVLRYNFVGKRMPSNAKRLREALTELEVLRECCADRDRQTAEMNSLQQKVADLDRQLRQAKDDAAARDANIQKALTLQDGHIVNFAVDQSEMSDQEIASLDTFIQDVLKAQGKDTVILIGEASSDGSSTHNQKLSERRADTVEKYLKEHGISTQYTYYNIAIGEKQNGDESHRRVLIKLF